MTPGSGPWRSGVGVSLLRLRTAGLLPLRFLWRMGVEAACARWSKRALMRSSASTRRPRGSCALSGDSGELATCAVASAKTKSNQICSRFSGLVENSFSTSGM